MKKQQLDFGIIVNISSNVIQPPWNWKSGWRVSSASCAAYATGQPARFVWLLLTLNDFFSFLCSNRRRRRRRCLVVVGSFLIGPSWSSVQDVVYALAHATGKTGRFTLIERWRNNERLLAPHEHPLKVIYLFSVDSLARSSNRQVPGLSLSLRLLHPWMASAHPSGRNGWHTNRPSLSLSRQTLVD